MGDNKRKHLKVVGLTKVRHKMRNGVVRVDIKRVGTDLVLGPLSLVVLRRIKGSFHLDNWHCIHVEVCLSVLVSNQNCENKLVSSVLFGTGGKNIIRQSRSNKLIQFEDAGFTIAVAVLVIAVLGFIASLGIPRAASSRPDMKIDWNPVTQISRIMAYASKDRAVFLSILKRAVI